MKYNVRVSVAYQTRVFNVAVNTLFPSECFNMVAAIAREYAPKYCTVVVNPGCKAHRGKALSLVDLATKLKELHFYHYVETEIDVEKFIPLATFYRMPFRPEYNCLIGATFFNAIDEKIMPDVLTGLSEVIPYTIYLAKSGSYYCWKHLDYRWLPNGSFQVGRVETTVEPIKIKKEYE